MQIWPILNAKGCKYVGLQTVYKTNYGTFDGSYAIDAEKPLPIRFIKSARSDVF